MWVRTRGSGKGQTGCRRAFEGVMAELPNQRQVQGRVRAESTRPTADPSQGREEPEGAKVSRHWKKLAARVVPTSSQDEALAHYGVSREVPCSALKGETTSTGSLASQRHPGKFPKCSP